MNETIAFRPEGRASTKDVVVNYTLASLDELEQLHPALNLLALPQFIIQRHKRKLTFIAQHAALPEQPLRLLPRPGRIALPGQQVQQSLLQADTVRMLIPQQPPVNRQRYAAHGIKTAAGFAVNICHASTELTGQVT